MVLGRAQPPQPGIIATLRHLQDTTHRLDGIFSLVGSYELVLHRDSREKMLTTSDRISPNHLIFEKNICTIGSGEAQLGRSQLAKIPQNPVTALELDS
jgi:hypothetical protein